MCEENQKGIDRLLDVILRLRGDEGCPWDREQTLDTLKQYLIEESYELVDAIESGDVEAHKEELGDVLLQVVLQTQIRDEEGEFDFNDVAHRLSEKLIHRHPHVFGDKKVANTEEVLGNWEALKAKEKKDGNRSAFDGVPRHLPALRKAHRVQTIVARVGFDWVDEKDVIAKIDEEIAELKESIAGGNTEEIIDELGDVLFSVVNLSRFRKLNAEDALEGTIAKFISRYQEVERRIQAEGKSMAECSIEEMERHWVDVKKGK